MEVNCVGAFCALVMALQSGSTPRKYCFDSISLSVKKRQSAETEFKSKKLELENVKSHEI